ncbi:D-alanine--D-alanine ligase [Candidatus Woesebacteria bacterium]|nr:D-alanine--D-alanine ligase [Candidatus Woesebacteria bacterium]
MSIITAVQMMQHVPTDEFEVVPLYIDKQGRWWTGSELLDINFYKTLDLMNPAETTDALHRIQFSPDPTEEHGIDVAIFCTHGGHGEDGTLAGLFELADIPFAAPGVVAAAVSIDKLVFKHVMEAAGVPVTKYVWFTRQEWLETRKEMLERVETSLEYPLFVKPATLGSSVGVTRAANEQELRNAIDLAAEFDTRLIVEEAARDCIEVNVSVIGTGDSTEVSTTEQPIQTDEFLSYADKYERGGGKKGGTKGMASLSRRIPAPISPDLEEKLHDTTRQIWKLLNGKGVARIDFFANPSSEEIWVGEVNAPPGSMAYYLWEATGKSYSELVQHLVNHAEAAHAEKHQLMHSIQSNILQKDQ